MTLLGAVIYAGFVNIEIKVIQARSNRSVLHAGSRAALFGKRKKRMAVAAWIACGMLTLRGVAGLVVDGASDPVRWPTFLIGGVLFGSVAWLARATKAVTSEEHSA